MRSPSPVTSLVVGLERFQLPDPSIKGDEGDRILGKPAGLKLGILFARLEDDCPLEDDDNKELAVSIEQRLDIPYISIDCYHDIGGIASRSQTPVTVRDSNNKALSMHAIDRSSLIAVWAMATVYWETGSKLLATFPAMKELKALMPRTIPLRIFQPKRKKLRAPFWSLQDGHGGTIVLIVAKSLANIDRRASLGMALLALLKVTEARFHEKIEEQLGDGEAAKLIHSASSFLHH